jgi:hypothetical protein
VAVGRALAAGSVVALSPQAAAKAARAATTKRILTVFMRVNFSGYEQRF